MRDPQDIIRELLKTKLTDTQSELIRELTNALGGEQEMLRSEILNQIEMKAGNKDSISIDEIKDIVMLAGKEI